MQENHRRYPHIFSLALDLLPIQASSVPCERVFSSAKETTTDRRNKLMPDLMEALQMLKFSFKKNSLSFTQGMSKETELSDLDEVTLGITRAPEDLQSYIRSLGDVFTAAL